MSDAVYKPGLSISHRSFSMADQREFAALSGDFNPIHLDPIAARRTIIGRPVVHGMHAVFAALEAFAAYSSENKASTGIAKLTAKFPKPIFVDDTVDFRIEEINAEGCRIVCQTDGASRMALSVTFGVPSPSEINCPPQPKHWPPITNSKLEELSESSGSVLLGLDETQAKQLFGGVIQWLGARSAAEMLAITRLVGMVCPGRHSLFAEFTAYFRPDSSGDNLNYTVTDIDDRFARIVMDVNGSALQGEVRAFFRPPPEDQPPITDISPRVCKGEFSERSALIVGGSRGIGEVVAKILAAGGGHSIITYHQGRSDALRVSEEIRSWGGNCSIHQLDVQKPGKMIEQIFNGPEAPTSLYYFPSPKIVGSRSGLSNETFADQLSKEFFRCYVTGLSRLINEAIDLEIEMSVFCPSTIFIDENPGDLETYVTAKKASEALCEFYAAHAPKIRTIIKRLPRIRTDQNSSLIPIETAEALDVMLPIVREVEKD